MLSPRAHRARLALVSRDSKLAASVAQRLGELGFRIAQVSPSGIGFEGPATLFEEVFHSALEETDSGWRFAAPPSGLPEGVASVYFPTKPEYAVGQASARRAGR